MTQQKQSVDLAISKTDRLQYLLFLPRDYGKNAKDRWPLIFFFHGRGERGDDLEMVKKFGLPQRLETWPQCPFVVVSPQCPADSYWTFKLDSLDALLDHVIQTYA